MKSDFVVPAHVSEKFFAAFSRAPRSSTPRLATSASASWVSNVAVTVPMQAPTMAVPIPVIATPAFCIVPKASFIFCTADGTPSAAPWTLLVMLSTISSTRDTRNTESIPMFTHLLQFFRYSFIIALGRGLCDFFMQLLFYSSEKAFATPVCISPCTISRQILAFANSR